jgi:hypothetical protein
MGSSPKPKREENVSKQWMVFACGVIALGGLLTHSPPGDAASGAELICLTEQPAIVEGESVKLNAWASTSDGRPVTPAVAFEWEAKVGRIGVQAAATRWDLSGVRVEPPDLNRKVIATVKAKPLGQSELRCTVEVLIGKKETTIPDRGTLSGENLIPARRFLLPGKAEAPGFGLYSYLLFSTPPKDDEERARYLKAIEAYLLVLQDVDDYLRRHIRPRGLNATYLPLTKMPAAAKSNDQWALNVLEVYDYAEARILLNRVKQASQNGPYLLSVLKPLSQPGTPAYLWEDLTGVVPDLTWDWIKFFTYLAAQERSWSEDSLRRFGLTLLNLIKIAGKVGPDTFKALETAIQFKKKL